MWNRFVYMYESVKYKEFYYAAHYKRSNCINTVWAAVLTLVSIASMLAWSISQSMPALWALLVASAQFAQCLIPMLPWSRQMNALRFLLPELKKMSLAIDREYMEIYLNRDLPDNEIKSMINKYETAFADLENQFVQDIVFPERKSVLDKAEKDKASYFFAKYPETMPGKGG